MCMLSQLLRDISAWLSTKDPTKYTEISLTMMATSSPCLDCQPEILDMLNNWIERLGFTVKYKLRISSLYHGNAPRLQSAVVEVQLADWKRTIQDSGVEFTLEPIAVCNEISLPNLENRQVNRDEVLRKRRRKDTKIARHVDSINHQPRMEEFFPPIGAANNEPIQQLADVLRDLDLGQPENNTE